MTKIKQFYEKFHKTETTNPVADFMQQERCNILRNLLKNVSGRVLIIGCGSQEDMSIIHKDCKGIGVDVSEEAIRKSKERYPQFEYRIADATKLPFAADSFDGVVCSEVIEHIPEDAKVYSEVKRVLKNGGSFIITTPNWLSWHGLARKIAENLFKKPLTSGDQPIDNWSTPSSLRKKLVQNGFRITLFRGIWYYPPAGKGSKRISYKLTLPVVKFLYPLDRLLSKILPWFGHMILFETEAIKNAK